MEKLRNTLNKVLNLLAGLSMTVMVVLTTNISSSFFVFGKSVAFGAGW